MKLFSPDNRWTSAASKQATAIERELTDIYKGLREKGLSRAETFFVISSALHMVDTRRSTPEMRIYNMRDKSTEYIIKDLNDLLQAIPEQEDTREP